MQTWNKEFIPSKYPFESENSIPWDDIADSMVARLVIVFSKIFGLKAFLSSTVYPPPLIRVSWRSKVLFPASEGPKSKSLTKFCRSQFSFLIEISILLDINEAFSSEFSSLAFHRVFFKIEKTTPIVQIYENREELQLQSIWKCYIVISMVSCG